MTPVQRVAVLVMAAMAAGLTVAAGRAGAWPVGWAAGVVTTALFAALGVWWDDDKEQGL